MPQPCLRLAPPFAPVRPEHIEPPPPCKLAACVLRTGLSQGWRGLSVLRRPAHRSLSLQRRDRLSRWPCGVPQRRAAQAVQASASPMPVALACFGCSLSARACSFVRAVPSFTAAGLTGRSRRHPTAGHNCSLRHQWLRRWLRLTFNVRRRVNVGMAIATAQAVPVRNQLGASVCCWRHTGPATAIRCRPGRAARPLAAGEPAVWLARALRRVQHGLSVRWRPAHRPAHAARFSWLSTTAVHAWLCGWFAPRPSRVGCNS